MQRRNHWGTLLVIPLLASACSVVGIRTVEEAGYAVIAEEGAFEVRDYGPLVVAETRVEGGMGENQNRAFFRLFDYISGENEVGQEIAMTAPVFQQPEGTKIAMTAPVFQERTESGWSMAFVLPREFSLETAPRPTSAAVVLREVPATRMAVVRYSGLRSEQALERHTERLLAWISEQELETRSGPRSAAYDPPFTVPFLRRNEVLIEVE